MNVRSEREKRTREMSTKKQKMRLWVEAGSEMKRILWVRKHSNNSVPTLKHKARWNEASNQPMVNYNEHWNIDNYDEDGKIQSKKKRTKKNSANTKQSIRNTRSIDWHIDIFMVHSMCYLYSSLYFILNYCLRIISLVSLLLLFYWIPRAWIYFVSSLLSTNTNKTSNIIKRSTFFMKFLWICFKWQAETETLIVCWAIHLVTNWPNAGQLQHFLSIEKNANKVERVDAIVEKTRNYIEPFSCFRRHQS